MSRYKKGFTLIELMLAMSFIAALLIVIAMTVIQISHIYTRGLTLKEVNLAGRSLSSELERSVAASSPFSVAGIGTQYINPVGGDGGRLCLGHYSYIWNYGKTLASGSFGFNVYSGVTSDHIRFVRVPDSTAKYCTSPGLAVDHVGAVELLDVGDLDLAVHSFTISNQPSATDTRTHQSLYFISFVIGTNEQAALNMTGQATCRPPAEMVANLNYCSVNQFDIIARAGNSVQ